MKYFTFIPIFSVFPLLMPTIAECQEESTLTATAMPQGVELNVPGTNSADTRSPRGSWNDTDFDGFLQQPRPPQSVTADGTITTDGDDDLYFDNRYGNQYDDQDVDDCANDTDDSVIR